MDGLTDESLSGDAAGERIADRADHRRWTDLTGQAATAAELPPVPFDVRFDRPLGIDVLTLVGELDLATVPLLREQLDRAMRGGRDVIIDLSGLMFIDSSGLHVLVGADRKLRDSGRRLVLVGGARAVRRLFELTSFDRRFEWFESTDQALHAVAGDIGSAGLPSRVPAGSWPPRSPAPPEE